MDKKTNILFLKVQVTDQDLESLILGKDRGGTVTCSLWNVIVRTLKHLTLATNEQSYYGGYIPESTWDFPALETLSLSNMQFGERYRDNSLNLFSKCVNLKDLTLRRFSVSGLDTFNICTSKLPTLTITDPDTFPKVFNVVAPQLQNLTASFNTSMKLRSHRAFSFKFLQFSTEGLDSL
ncbi:hypothetical protein OSB04_019813 [Centaurea solstitialis]|uniref:Uncharacterized protein n=1 Tax=Centaurea solstitialis TaxID=347529 RepID=A0AA38T396_9ASTR|nr:hypothetical protein OSB04_019813 [Centaurea solstitialis]